MTESSPLPAHIPGTPVEGPASDVRQTPFPRSGSDVVVRFESRLLEAMYDAIVVSDTNGIVTKWNEGAVRLLGWTAAEMVGRSVFDRIPVADRPAAEQFFASVLAGREFSGVYRDTHKEGRSVWLDLHLCPVRDETGRVVAVHGASREYTARHRAETALAESEKRFRSVAELIPDHLYVLDPDDPVTPLRVLYANPAAARAHGYEPSEFIGQSLLSHVAPSDHSTATAYAGRIRAGEVVTFEETHRHRDGGPLPVEVRGRLIEWDGRHAILGIDRDLSERSRAEQSLRKVNERYALLAGTMQDIIYLMGRDGLGAYVSPSCERLLGYTPDEVVGLSPTRFVHPHEREAFALAKAENYAGRPTHKEWRYRHKAGHWVWMESLSNPVFDDAGTVTGVVCCVRDISRRKAAEDGARTAQKLEAIGRLAGGIAHDFNNLLTVVNGCAELLLGAIPEGDPRRKLVEDVATAGERGAALTRQLLTFSRQQPVRAVPLNVNDVVAGTTRMLTRLLGEDVAVELRLAPDLPAARVDRGQFEQVVVNLAVNARDAMPAGGRLTIATADVDFAGRDDLPPDARPERYVRVDVTDTGTGMAPDVLAHLFEPFFTTKPVGRGTGLGLATVHGIVRQARGFVTVTSDVGVGTTFCVFLPAVPRDERPPAAAPEPDAVAGGTETVLVVEDDDAVRALTSTVLERKGYDVIAAASAADALAVCDGRSAMPDLVVTDLIMPGMSGRELAAELETRDPAVKLIYLSGYAPDSAAFHGLDRDRAAFLQKPFAADDLARLVRKTLDGMS